MSTNGKQGQHILTNKMNASSTNIHMTSVLYVHRQFAFCGAISAFLEDVRTSHSPG